MNRRGDGLETTANLSLVRQPTIDAFNIFIVHQNHANLIFSSIMFAPTTTETVFIDDVAVGAGYFVSSISNDKGIQIPGTGGIGTTIFYIVGSLMMAVAVVFLITKKRMCAQTEK